MQYLIDTNVISEIMRKSPNERVVQWFSELDKIYMSVVTLDEVIYGLSRKNLVNKLSWFRQFCGEMVRFIEITDSIAKWSGEKRAELENRGVSITMADSLIAGTAHESGLVLATRNVKDFQHTGVAIVNPFGME